MDIATLRDYLDDPGKAAGWLASLGLTDFTRAHAALVEMATSGLTLDLAASLAGHLERFLVECPDPDMALNNLCRFVAATRNRLSLAAFFDRDPVALRDAIQIFSNSQYLSDLLVADPESLDLLRLTQGEPLARETLVEELVAEIDQLERDQAVMGALRRFKYRETLRIAFADIIRGYGVRTIARQISLVADAVLEAALHAAWKRIVPRRGTPRRADGRPARMAVLGMGKLGGVELNYSSDIDLVFLYDEDGMTDAQRPITNQEFFNHLAREFVRLLTESTDLGGAYRVDLRLRPDGQRGSMVNSMAAALSYYDLRGRTWERQAYIKARPVAGDLELGSDFLNRLRPWIYRRYLTRADISGIKTLKRRIERRASDEGVDQRNVKTGHGGIRDVEFVIQFLQMLNGASTPDVQTGNTLDAIAQLEDVGCLSHLERSLLSENYEFLRKIEHRLQILFDLQTHLLPESATEMRKVALRMGYADTADCTALEAFSADYADKTAVNRRILDHLLHDAFPDDAQAEAEVDLVLDPRPPNERIEEVLGKYHFRNVKLAYQNLMALAEENIRFLSTRRCRHFLAAIAPRLLEAISRTPDPDSTLINLDKVSASLGGKGVLWELFSFNRPSLRLYVELCAYSPYLSGILTSNPGMSDELMDSLVLDRLPSPESLKASLAELCQSAENVDPILHSFKIDQKLRVGVRDLLGKEDIQSTAAALSAIAEACLTRVAEHEYKQLIGKFGRPTIVREADGSSDRAARPCEPIILALGKFGGREMNYHSDLDLVFLYEADGHTESTSDGGQERTTNQHFFSELSQRIIKRMSRSGVFGRLYEIDARLRPTGKSGALATSLVEFERYFTEGDGQLWERQALCKARVVHGSARVAAEAQRIVRRAAFESPWRDENAEEIRRMRRRLEVNDTPADLKRGTGGIVDIEFVVQMLQLKHGRAHPAIRRPNTPAALAALHAEGLLDDDDYEFFDRGYRFLRTLESRLRLISNTPQRILPDEPTELAKLSHLMRYADNDALLADYRRYREENRRRFDRIFDAARK
ncbi:MAG TPA: bifunctional [glutamate--ammonia ligase]-adenylyl-L-tyrosine phosphorylase/[glutamate--ammonia-ligase] adenylyltransferase [Planctomycetaceae bacterium]|nr:bifunctional [glutamate--ammonia ligase]-adenylyl-L-tyrosine phosphorylase/[glutamate--ammonia-ligase] adenylyltransferase [Planctomycetaceae bacterium]